MATQTLAHARSEREPYIPDGDLERLLAEMFAHRRRMTQASSAPHPAPRPRPVAAAPAALKASPPPLVRAPEPRPVERRPDADSVPVEPLHLADRPRRGRRLAAAALALSALAAGWWAAGAPGPMQGLALLQNGSLVQALPLGPKAPPVILAPPPAATRVLPPPQEASTAPVTPPPVSAAAAPAPAIAPDAPPVAVAPPRTLSPDAPRDGAGVLGVPQVSPFDHAAQPRQVRTTAILPPRAAEAEAQNAAPRVLNFDDPTTWPAGAAAAPSHPLPPPRP